MQNRIIGIITYQRHHSNLSKKSSYTIHASAHVFISLTKNHHRKCHTDSTVSKNRSQIHPNLSKFIPIPSQFIQALCSVKKKHHRQLQVEKIITGSIQAVALLRLLLKLGITGSKGITYAIHLKQAAIVDSHLLSSNQEIEGITCTAQFKLGKRVGTAQFKLGNRRHHRQHAQQEQQMNIGSGIIGSGICSVLN